MSDLITELISNNDFKELFNILELKNNILNLENCDKTIIGYITLTFEDKYVTITPFDKNNVILIDFITICKLNLSSILRELRLLCPYLRQ